MISSNDNKVIKTPMIDKERNHDSHSRSSVRRSYPHKQNTVNERTNRSSTLKSKPVDLEKAYNELRKNANFVRQDGEWSEHISSSSKHYYYNIKSGDSVWEKPKGYFLNNCSPRNRESNHKHVHTQQPPHKKPREVSTSHHKEKSPSHNETFSNSAVSKLVEVLSIVSHQKEHTPAHHCNSSNTDSGNESRTDYSSHNCRHVSTTSPSGQINGITTSSAAFASESIRLSPLERPARHSCSPQPLPLPDHQEDETFLQLYNPELAAHAVGWQTEPLERQADVLSTEVYRATAIESLQISADLKFARSLVRVSEIQSTLQETRIHFIRQQIYELEGSQTPTSLKSLKS